MAQAAGGKRIVWVDEDTDIIGPVVRPLELAGHHIRRIHSVAEALQPEAIEAMRAADLILLDMILPPGETERLFGPYPGVEILSDLRTLHGVTTPVLVLSVVTNPELRARLEALNVADIVRKPVLPSELKRRVEAILNRPMAGR